MSKIQFILFLLLIVLLFVSLTGVFFYFSKRIGIIESRIVSFSRTDSSLLESGVTPVVTAIDSCGENCKKTVEELISKAVSTISSKTKVIEKTTIPSKSTGTSYIPMGSTYTTTSTGWFTLDDSAVYVDLINDYGSSATVSFEASLKVAHGNGQAYVRLWDDTNKIAVNNSELTTINNRDYILVSSGKLPFWKGRNLYKLQLKSLNSFEVSLTGGKIKVSY